MLVKKSHFFFYILFYSKNGKKNIEKYLKLLGYVWFQRKFDKKKCKIKKIERKSKRKKKSQ